VDVLLVVDNREKKSNSDRNYIQDQLVKAKVPCCVRALALGDFLWIGRTECGEEVVLNCIAERKQLPDLISSIVDGRYKGSYYFALRVRPSASHFLLCRAKIQAEGMWSSQCLLYC